MQVNELLYRDDVIVSLLRNRLIMDLVYKEEGNKQLLKEGLSFLNVSASFAFPTLAVIEPSGFFQEERERRKYTGRIRDYLQRHAAAEGSVVFEDEEGRIGLLFSWVSKEAVEAVQAKLGGQFARPISIGVGLPCSKLSDVHLSYRQALLALEDKFYKGVGRAVYYNELGIYRRIDEYPITRERELFERVKDAADMTDIEEAVNEFYDHLLEEGPLERPNIDEWTIRLLIGLEKRAFAEAGDESEPGSYNGYNVMSIVKMETLHEVKTYVCSRLRAMLKSVQPAGIENQRVIIKKTIEYMEREFECATLHNTAQKVYMTPTYLSALFKSNTGKTFIEQLTDIRIEKAKHMLKCTLLKNYEVAEKVGYKDSRYFSQIFKKKVGLSPSEYRESAAK